MELVEEIKRGKEGFPHLQLCMSAAVRGQQEGWERHLMSGPGEPSSQAIRSSSEWLAVRRELVSHAGPVTLQIHVSMIDGIVSTGLVR